MLIRAFSTVRRSSPAGVALGAALLAFSCGDSAVPRGPNLQAEPLECMQQSAGDLYEQRIKPLLEQDRPHSCNQCHLSGIELASFARATPCETMACLVQKDLVDLDNPEDSTILTWIKRAKPESKLITEKVIDEEYEGFLSWIQFSSTCDSYQCAGIVCSNSTPDPLCEGGAPASHDGKRFDPKNDPGDCSDKTLEQLFQDTVYAARGRCYSCHSSAQKEAPKEAPRWLSEVGNCDQASLTTMRTVLRLKLVNVAEPKKSLLLLKPLSIENGGVMHGGGAKFDPRDDDAGYVNFSYWLTRYAACQKPAK